MSDPNDRYRPTGPDDPTSVQPASPPADLPPAPNQLTDLVAPTAPQLAAPPPARRSGGPVRWIVALLVTVLVVAAVGGVALFASKTSAPASPGLAYMPPGVFTYSDVRLDLPGDQRQKVGDFLAHFPGFADRSTLDQGLDQLLDRLLRTGTKERYTYTADIKPWFSGQISLATLAIPAVPSLTGLTAAPSPGAPSAAMDPGRILVVVGVTDRAKAQTELDKIKADITQAGASIVSQDHAGTSIVTVTHASGGPGVSYALTADAVVLSTSVDDLTAALDRKTSNGDNLGTSAAYKDNAAKLKADRVGTSYVNLDSVRSSLAGLVPAGQPGSAVLTMVLTRIPSVVMSSIRFDSDRLVIDGVTKAVGGTAARTGVDSGLTKHAPSDSLAYLEIGDVGTFVRDLVTAIKVDPLLVQAGPSVQQQINQVEGVLGAKLENYFDWLDNISVTGGLSAGQPQVAIIASVNDEATAKTRITQLTQLLTLAGTQLGLKIRQVDDAGTQLTLIDLPAAAGLPSGSAIGFAIKDKTFYLAFGEAYLKKLVELTPDASLGQATRFSDALKAAGGPATGGALMYVDITAIRTLIEAQLPADARTKYEQEIKPYLLPLDQIISAVVQDGADQQTHFQFIVK